MWGFNFIPPEGCVDIHLAQLASALLLDHPCTTHLILVCPPVWVCRYKPQTPSTSQGHFWAISLLHVLRRLLSSTFIIYLDAEGLMACGFTGDLMFKPMSCRERVTEAWVCYPKISRVLFIQHISQKIFHETPLRLQNRVFQQWEMWKCTRAFALLLIEKTQSQQGGITIPQCFGKWQHRTPSHLSSTKLCAAGNFKAIAGNAGIKQILKNCISPSTCAEKPHRKQIMPLQQWGKRALWASAISMATLILFLKTL